MWKVLIVDDEYLAQAQMRHILQWEKCGFSVEGICSNGKQAVEFLKNTPIDIVFTDVCMPIMNGIELTQFINTNYPHTKVVITSSYSDLNYVKDAFKANAFDYILKHMITEESMKELLKKIDESLTADSNKAFNQGESYEKKPDFDYNKKISETIIGKKQDTPILNSVVTVGAIHNFSIVEQTHSPEDIKILFDNIINTISYALKDVDGFVIFLYTENRIVLYLPFSKHLSEPEIMNSLYNHVRQINYSMKKFFNLSFLWGVSRLSSKDYTLSDCFQDALLMLDTNPIIDKNRPIRTNHPITLSINHERELMSAISVLDENRINRCLSEIFDGDTSGGLAVSILLGELLTFANRICVDYHIDINDIFSSFPEDNQKIINSIKTAEEALAYSMDFFKALMNEYKKQVFPSRNSM